MIITVFFMYAIRGVFIGQLTTDLNDSTKENTYMSLEKDNYRQYFMPERTLQGIDILVSNKNGEETMAQLQLSLYDASNDILLEKSVSDVVKVSNNTVIGFSLQESNLSETIEFYFTLEVLQGEKLQIPATAGEYNEMFRINGQEENYRFCFSVKYGQVKHLWMFLLTGILLLVVLELLFMQIDKLWGRFKPEHLFLVLALTSGIAIAFINPPSQEADGWEHFLRSMDVSYGNILAPFTNLNHEPGVIEVPDNIYEFGFRVIPPEIGAGNLYLDNLKNMYISENSMNMQYDSTFVSLFYLPQGLGLFIGRLVGTSMYMAVVLARVLNLFVYCLLAYLAIRKIPMYKNLLMVIALLPMSIYQAASCSPDALLNGFSFLFLALCLEFAYTEQSKLSWKHGLMLGTILGCLFMCKYIYLCMGLLLFLIPVKKFGGKKEYLKAFGFVMIPLILIIAAMLPTFYDSVSLNTANGSVGMSQSGFVLQNPFYFVRVFVNTMERNFDVYANQLNTFGWLNYKLGPLITIIPCFITAVGCMDSNPVSKIITVKDRWICLLTFSFCTFAMMLGLYIGDGRINPVGAGMILGVQGRYFIPILIMPFIALGSRKIENRIEFFSLKAATSMGAFLLYSIRILMQSCY